MCSSPFQSQVLLEVTHPQCRFFFIPDIINEHNGLFSAMQKGTNVTDNANAHFMWSSHFYFRFLSSTYIYSFVLTCMLPQQRQDKKTSGSK